eukprot:6293435-Prymnesium_polylepis.1
MACPHLGRTPAPSPPLFLGHLTAGRCQDVPPHVHVSLPLGRSRQRYARLCHHPNPGAPAGSPCAPIGPAPFRPAPIRPAPIRPAPFVRAVGRARRWPCAP